MMHNREFDSSNQLWDKGAIRAFISHKAERKTLATEIKKHLNSYGIACFVAHEDIEPMKEWQSEMEQALFSMDIMVALLTEKFDKSDWTDQEIGVAVGRKVPIIPVRLGKDPYGFIGRYQAISGSDKSNAEISREIFTLLLKDKRLTNMVKDAYIIALAKSGSFSRSNSLAEFLPYIDELSPEQTVSIIKVFNSNTQVNQAFAFNSDSPTIADHLKRMTGDNYKFHKGSLSLELIDDLLF